MIPGVYILKRAGVPVYVGRGTNVFRRLNAQAPHFKGRFDTAEVLTCKTHDESECLEADLIEKHRPSLNRAANPHYEYPCGPDRKPFERYPHQVSQSPALLNAASLKRT